MSTAIRDAAERADAPSRVFLRRTFVERAAPRLVMAVPPQTRRHARIAAPVRAPDDLRHYRRVVSDQLRDAPLAAPATGCIQSLDTLASDFGGPGLRALRDRLAEPPLL